jgi:hypothetical protein
VACGLAAATIATAGAHLGGILAFAAPGDEDDAPRTRGGGTDARGTTPGTDFAAESLRIG